MAEIRLDTGLSGTVREVGFEADFYLKTYPDVQAARADPAGHYLKFGLDERRYGSSEQLEADIEIIRASGLFDFDYFKKHNGPCSDPIREYLVSCWRIHAPSADFYSDFIQQYYPLTLARGENPFAFYCRNAHKPWCHPSLASAQNQAETVGSSPLFSQAYFLREVGNVAVDDAAAYYCTEGYRLLADPSLDFSTAAYMLQYTDIMENEFNPLLHYTKHGKAEGRLKFSVRDLSVHTGSQAFHPAKPTLLICSHEASRSGAPIVAFNLARHLGTRFNIVSMVLRDGGLSAEFAKVSTQLIVSGDSAGQIECAMGGLMRQHRIDVAILNSAECTKLLPALVKHGIPSVSLLHEFPQYVRPFNLLAGAITLSDAVVFPSELVQQEGLKEAQRLGLGPMRLTNLYIRPQGRPLVPFGVTGRRMDVRLPPKLQALSKSQTRPLIVLGAGHVQTRKGVDLFIEAARILKHELGVDCRFVWVGGGYAPKTDLGVSPYLADQVERSALTDVVVFVPEQASLKPFWDLADAFFMSSRLDPFPNVALDAIAEGLPVVCFQKATGIADLAALWSERVHAAPYNDVRDATRVFAALAGRRDRGESLRIVPDAEVEQFLSFARYADAVGELVDAAVEKRDERQRRAQSLRDDPRFRPELLEESLPAWLKPNGANAWRRSGSLAELAAISAANGVPLGYLWPGKIASWTDQAAPSEPAWGEADFRVVQTGSGQETAVPYRALLFVEDQPTLDVFSDALFQVVEIGHVAIVSISLEETDLEALRATAGPDRVSLHRVDPDRPDQTLAALNARLGQAALVHFVKAREAEPGVQAKAESLFLDAAVTRSALSMLATSEIVQVVLKQPDWSAPYLEAHSNRGAPTYESGRPLPDRLVDQTQAWCRLQPAGWTDDLIKDLLAKCIEGDLDGVWDSLADPVRRLRPDQRGLVATQDRQFETTFGALGEQDAVTGQRVAVKVGETLMTPGERKLG